MNEVTLIPPVTEQRSQTRVAAGQQPQGAQLSIVIPTFNERDNLEPLVAGIARALQDIEWEIIIVDDDSPDGTAAAAREYYRRDPRVRSIRRVGRRGLASACIEGMLSSSAPIVAVMDADLQHDPALLPIMLKRLHLDEADVVVASRYVAGGDLGDWSHSRANASRLASRLAHRLTGISVQDPMSGYFMLRREIVEEHAQAYSGLGFKILLDILVTGTSSLRVTEVPLHFGTRMHGDSKASVAVAWEYLLFLAEKASGGRLPVRFIAFSAVGAAGVGVHFVVLLTALKLLGTSFIVGQTAATFVSILSNFSINNLLTYADRRLRGIKWLKGLASFALICGFGALTNVGIAGWLFARNGHWAVAALAGIAASAVWNYGVSARFTWSASK